MQRCTQDTQSSREAGCMNGQRRADVGEGQEKQQGWKGSGNGEYQNKRTNKRNGENQNVHER